MALTVDTGPENILFAGASVHLSVRYITGWSSEGVNLVWNISLSLHLYKFDLVTTSDGLPVTFLTPALL